MWEALPRSGSCRHDPAPCRAERQDACDMATAYVLSCNLCWGFKGLVRACPRRLTASVSQPRAAKCGMKCSRQHHAAWKEPCTNSSGGRAAAAACVGHGACVSNGLQLLWSVSPFSNLQYVMSAASTTFDSCRIPEQKITAGRLNRFLQRACYNSQWYATGQMLPPLLRPAVTSQDSQRGAPHQMAAPGAPAEPHPAAYALTPAPRSP